MNTDITELDKLLTKISTKLHQKRKLHRHELLEIIQDTDKILFHQDIIITHLDELLDFTIELLSEKQLAVFQQHVDTKIEENENE